MVVQNMNHVFWCVSCCAVVLGIWLIVVLGTDWSTTNLLSGHSCTFVYYLVIGSTIYLLFSGTLVLMWKCCNRFNCSRNSFISKVKRVACPYCCYLGLLAIFVLSMICATYIWSSVYEPDSRAKCMSQDWQWISIVVLWIIIVIVFGCTFIIWFFFAIKRLKQSVSEIMNAPGHIGSSQREYVASNFIFILAQQKALALKQTDDNGIIIEIDLSGNIIEDNTLFYVLSLYFFAFRARVFDISL